MLRAFLTATAQRITDAAISMALIAESRKYASGDLRFTPKTLSSNNPRGTKNARLNLVFGNARK